MWRPQSLFRVFFKALFNEQLCLLAEYFLAEFGFALEDEFEHDLVVLVVERGDSGHHFVGDDSDCPVVHFNSVRLISELFGWEVLGRSAESRSGHLSLRFLQFWEAKIRYFYVAVAVEEDILWLQVAHDDLLRVELLQGQDELGDYVQGRALAEVLILLQMVEKLAAAHEIQHQIQIISVLKRTMQPDQIRMIQLRQNLQLGIRMLQLVRLQHQRLLNHLHRIQLIIRYSPC